MTVKDGDNSVQSLSMLKSGTIESPWVSNSLDPQITIDFDEEVYILDVVLKRSHGTAEQIAKCRDSLNIFDDLTNLFDDLKASFKNIR